MVGDQKEDWDVGCGLRCAEMANLVALSGLRAGGASRAPEEEDCKKAGCLRKSRNYYNKIF
jgi:hypothetical protein